MYKEYKTRKSTLVVSFILKFIAFLSLMLIVYIAIYESIHGNFTTDLTSPIVFALPVPSAVLAAYFAFYRGNITLVVNDSGVQFLRGSKVFRDFQADKYVFGSYVCKHTHNFIPVRNDRCLRVIKKANEKYKDYRCNFLNKSEFNEMISYTSLLGRETTETTEVAEIKREKTEGSEPLVFTINKESLIKRIKKNNSLVFFVALFAFIFMVAYVWLLEVDNSAIVSFGGLAVVIFAFVFIRLFATQPKIFQSIPEEIQLCSDSITIDSRKFYFTYIKQIKATPPAYEDDKESLSKIIRKLVIVERSETFVYIVGTASDMTEKEPVFAEYGVFCAELKAIFADNPEKFVYNLV
jgi:hypothetical protein